MTDNVAVGINHFAFFVDAADHVAVQIDYCAVGHYPADNVAVFVINIAHIHRFADHVTVIVNHRSVGQHAAGNVAVDVNHRTVGIDIADYVVVVVVNQFAVVGNADNVAFPVHRQTVFIHPADDIAVFVIDIAVLIGITDYGAARTDDCPLHFLCRRGSCRSATGRARNGFAEIAVFLIDGIAVNRHFFRLGAVLGNIAFVPGNDKVVLNVSGHNRSPAHGNVAGFLAAQKLAAAVVVELKTVKGRLRQLNRYDHHRGFAVGAERQDVFGISAEHHLPQRNRVRGRRQRNFRIAHRAELYAFLHGSVVNDI